MTHRQHAVGTAARFDRARVVKNMGTPTTSTRAATSNIQYNRERTLFKLDQISDPKQLFSRFSRGGGCQKWKSRFITQNFTTLLPELPLFELFSYFLPFKLFSSFSSSYDRPFVGPHKLYRSYWIISEKLRPLQFFTHFRPKQQNFHENMLFGRWFCTFFRQKQVFGSDFSLKNRLRGWGCLWIRNLIQLE